MTADNVRTGKSNQTTSRGEDCGLAPAMFFGASAIGIGLILFFLAQPRFDLTVTNALYVAPHRFIGSEAFLVHLLRNIFSGAFFVICVLTAVGCFLSLLSRRNWLGLSPRRWLYLAACLLIGPLTITNLGFKDHWGRPRPTAVLELGGSKLYVAPLKESNECDRNCSFVSGEASSIYIVCFAAAFLFPSAAVTWTVMGMMLGTVAGFVRMAEGGHFLSDVLFAGVLMALTASALHMLFIAASHGD